MEEVNQPNIRNMILSPLTKQRGKLTLHYLNQRSPELKTDSKSNFINRPRVRRVPDRGPPRPKPTNKIGTFSSLILYICISCRSDLRGRYFFLSLREKERERERKPSFINSSATRFGFEDDFDSVSRVSRDCDFVKLRRKQENQ